MNRVMLGMLTPSSNTVLEPVTTAMLADLPEVSAHFSRFPVTEIALTGPALAQFNTREILRAAELLAHAKIDVICWNGTSAGWHGFATDERLCAEVEQQLRVPACTSVLALNEVFARTNVKRFALVTPYLADVQSAIVETTTAPATSALPNNISICKTTSRSRKSHPTNCAPCFAPRQVRNRMRSPSFAPICVARRSRMRWNTNSVSRSTTPSLAAFGSRSG
jgi:hypothetical protein